jgi:hypothetical protein
MAPKFVDITLAYQKCLIEIGSIFTRSGLAIWWFNAFFSVTSVALFYRTGDGKLIG